MSTNNFDDDFDFGFTTVSEESLTSGQQELNTQLQQLYNAIIPLLKNLKSNPDKEYILWPDRVAKIKQFKQKIDKIVGDSVVTKDI